MKETIEAVVASFREGAGLSGLAGLGAGRRASAWDQEVVRERVDAWLERQGLQGRRAAMLRGVALLWHDHLIEAHEIAQKEAGVDGSFLHAVMHRREGDYWNSKYWWGRVGVHPCFKPLAGRVLELLSARNEPELASHLLPGGRWSPEALVGACEAVAEEAEEAPAVRVLREVQKLETEVFITHLLAGLAGGAG